MASAASGFVLSLNVAAATTNSRVVMFNTKNNTSRFVVKASDEPAAAAPATATPPAEAEAKPKPPPIGPKRGAKVSYPQNPIFFVVVVAHVVQNSYQHVLLFSFSFLSSKIYIIDSKNWIFCKLNTIIFSNYKRVFVFYIAYTASCNQCIKVVSLLQIYIED